MSKIEIKLGDVSMNEHDHESPVRIVLSPQPVPPQWEGLLFSRWLEAQRKSGKFPDLSVVNGVITVACRWEDYRQFFHQEVEQKVAETNDLFNREREETMQRVIAEEKAALQRSASDREAVQQRLKEIAAFNELRRFQAGSEENQPHAPADYAQMREPEMASGRY